ncbi:siderophore ABC transporter substrate-binding protein [Roseinatronobacter alkalisoli]|uniref:Siderophore ABC transporter substrate-binding protein n=1 Tax=Roseinatronobacter alkalisoli TaxID=3028235 RepID=A0ABT5TD56_9RHOB|nr:siderophore ABC transporter substrate-binding protein [Roseinatronobacter sp. HJB301]MDD7973065.1 siderophore ABC transporter substrate-binding protein [Roseinatronobacter sp. HJB301]
MKLTLCAAAVCLAPVVGMAQDVTVETHAGPVTLQAGPQNVVALDLAAIDALSALDVAIAAVPSVTPPAYLARVMQDLPAVGTLFEPDFEALAVMGPDLIVAGGRSQAQVGALSRVAPTIDMTIMNDGLIEQARDRVAAYGALFDKADAADALIAQLDDALASTAAAVTGKGSALIVQTNGGKLSAYGADSRFGWLHNAVGLPQAFDGITAENHGESVSFEFIAEVNPDWLLVLDRAAAIGQDGEAAAVTLDNPLIAGTTAGQRGQIIYLDGGAIYLAGGGIQSVQIVLDQIRTAFEGSGS